MRESQIGAVSHTVAQITHKCFSDIIPQKADEPLFSPCNLYSPRQSWSVLILGCLHSEENKIGQPSKVLTLWANWFHRCYDNMVITICQNSSWIGNNRKIQQHLPLAVVKKWKRYWRLSTLLIPTHIQLSTNFWKTDRKINISLSHHAVHHDRTPRYPWNLSVFVKPRWRQNVCWCQLW